MKLVVAEAVGFVCVCVCVCVFCVCVCVGGGGGGGGGGLKTQAPPHRARFQCTLE